MADFRDTLRDLNMLCDKCGSPKVRHSHRRDPASGQWNPVAAGKGAVIGALIGYDENGTEQYAVMCERFVSDP